MFELSEYSLVQHCYSQNLSSASLFDDLFWLGIFLLYKLDKFQLHSHNWGWEASKTYWIWASKKTDFEDET